MTPLTLLPIAESVAKLSKDPSTKVGAVIVGAANEVRALGWNGFPRGVHDWEERYTQRETKYKFIVHAEVNAICNAARSGVSIEGCSLLVTALHPCNDCAKAIIQAGITHVYAPQPRDVDERWNEAFRIAKVMFDEANVEVHFYEPAR